tara:strand:+ start:96 stop:686 length:591 start_codon:yes stop_codon:yes gene_type:complete
MPLSKVQSGGISLSDNFSFTGTVTGTGSNIKEKLAMLCDGGTYTVSSGSYTSTNITASHQLTTSYADMPGSSITYTPPAGTTCVIYEFCFSLSFVDTHSISHYKFFIDSDEAVYHRKSLGGQADQSFVTAQSIIPIGGSANTNTGRQSSWTGAKTLKMQCREYGSGNEAKLFGSVYWDSTGSDEFQTPTLTITALG